MGDQTVEFAQKRVDVQERVERQAAATPAVATMVGAMRKRLIITRSREPSTAPTRGILRGVSPPRAKTSARVWLARAGVWLLRPGLELMIDGHMLWQYRIAVGSEDQVDIHPTASVANTIFNAGGGTIRVERHAFFGQNVLILAASHHPSLRGDARLDEPPLEGLDIVIGEGAWVASGAIVIGPCVIGPHAVVAAGSVVTRDVEPETMVAGVPARFVRRI